MCVALEVMRSYNEHALIGMDGRCAVMIEDVLIDIPELTNRTDGQSPYFRIEIQSDPSGKHALALVRYNPFSKPGEGKNAGCDLLRCHIATDGAICIGSSPGSGDPMSSPYDLDFVIPRARYAVLAFCSYRLTGSFPQPV